MCTPPLLENSYLRVPKHLLVNRVIRNVFNVQYISCSDAEMWAYGFTCGQLVWSKMQRWHFQYVHIITTSQSGSLQLRGILSLSCWPLPQNEWLVLIIFQRGLWTVQKFAILSLLFWWKRRVLPRQNTKIRMCLFKLHFLFPINTHWQVGNRDVQAAPM